MYAEEAKATGAECWSADVGAAKAHNLEWVEGVRGEGLSRTLGRIYTGGNSGYQALGLAYQLGAVSVILVGFDMKTSGGKVHWHGDHPPQLGNEGPYDAWIARFAQMAVDCKAVGMRVVNASRETALHHFEEVSLETALGTEANGWRTPLLVKGMMGLGDNLYQRGIVQALATCHDVHVETPWPQLYDGLGVKCVLPATRLRTQAKNVAATESWADLPKGCPVRHLTYTHRPGTMLGALGDEAGLLASEVAFAAGPPVTPARRERPYVVVRPATVRREWVAESRNPKPEYIAEAVERVRATHHVISVADLHDGHEWIVGSPPYADEQFHKGELSVTQLMELVAGAAGVIGGVGWLLPAAVAYSVPMLLLFGGCGLHNGPKRIFDPRMDTSRVVQAVPDHFCQCEGKQHDCNKTISRLGSFIDDFALRLVAPPATPVAPRTRARVLPSGGPAVRPRVLGQLPKTRPNAQR